jgi:hypothetical protein
MYIGLQNIALDLVSALQILPSSRLPRSSGGGENLFSDLSRLNLAIYSDDFDIERIMPLLNAVLSNEPDEIVWDRVYAAVTESTLPPFAARPTTPPQSGPSFTASFQQTP